MMFLNYCCRVAILTWCYFVLVCCVALPVWVCAKIVPALAVAIANVWGKIPHPHSWEAIVLIVLVPLLLTAMFTGKGK